MGDGVSIASTPKECLTNCVKAVQKDLRCEAGKSKYESGRLKTEIPAFSFHNSYF
jgi:hypothetical protein